MHAHDEVAVFHFDDISPNHVTGVCLFINKWYYLVLWSDYNINYISVTLAIDSVFGHSDTPSFLHVGSEACFISWGKRSRS